MKYLLLIFTLISLEAEARFQVSFGAGYNRTNYSDSAYTFSRRYSASVSYSFFSDSEIEFNYFDTTDRTVIPGVQNTTFNDRVYSLNLVQVFLPESFFIRPFVRLGIGQLNRDAKGSYTGGGEPPAKYDRLTGVIGTGLRCQLTDRIGLKVEATSYLSGAELSTWEDNIASQVSLFFVF